MGWVQKSIGNIYETEHSLCEVIRTIRGGVSGTEDPGQRSSAITYRSGLWDSPEKSPIQAPITRKLDVCLGENELMGLLCFSPARVFLVPEPCDF